MPPKLQLGAIKPVADEKTLEAVIANRYEVMAGYAREMRRACKAEIAVLKAKGADLSLLKAAKRWLHRDDDKVPAAARPQLAQARAAHPVLDKMVTMREELRQMWLNTSQSREQLAADLQAWCRRAEESGIAALQQFSMRCAPRTPDALAANEKAPRAGFFMSRRSCSDPGKKSPAMRGFLLRVRPNYFSLVSLYSTCLRALGSNFMIDIFSGIVFLFLLVV